MNCNGTLSRVIEQYKINPSDPSPIFIPDSNRIMLAELFGHLGFKRGAEIGVGSGIFSEIICKKVPGVRMYCIDAWQPYSDYVDYTDDKYLELDYQTARSRLAPYRAEFLRMFSVEAAGCFADGDLDFVYIDANHFEPYVTMDLEAWARKVRRGGIVSGHDYINVHSMVPEAVDKFVYRHGINPVMLMGSPKCVSTDNADLTPSFFWVQP